MKQGDSQGSAGFSCPCNRKMNLVINTGKDSVATDGKQKQSFHMNKGERKQMAT